VHTFLRSETKTFLAHRIRSLANHYTTYAENKSECAENRQTLHQSQTVVHQVINSLSYCLCLPGYEIPKNRPVNLFSHNIRYGVWYAWSCLSLSNRLENKFVLELPMRLLSTSFSLNGC